MTCEWCELPGVMLPHVTHVRNKHGRPLASLADTACCMPDLHCTAGMDVVRVALGRFGSRECRLKCL